MSGAEDAKGRRPAAWLAVLAGAAVVVAYGSLRHAGFLWDDGGHVTAPSLRGLSGLARIWFLPGATQQYYPVLHSAFWLEHRLWGDAAIGYHVLNVLLHLAASWLFFRTLRALGVRGAAAAAALFAVHPVCVESVAWIAEQKNTLSAVFYFLAALCYLRYEGDRSAGRYSAATALFVLALLTKSVTATLPAALLVVAWWRRGRLTWSGDVGPLAPWIALGAAAGAVTAWMERTQIGAHGAGFTLGFAERVLLAGRAVFFYAGKVLWPAGLTFIYPRWSLDAGRAWQWLYPAALLALLGALFALRGRCRGPLATALLFCGTLSPALGFIDVYPFLYSYVADHFQYLAAAMLLAGVCAGASLAFARLGGVARAAALGAGLAVMGALAITSARRVPEFRDARALWTATLARNPACWLAYDNLGGLALREGRRSEAVADCRAALALHPDAAGPHNTLGVALLQERRPQEAIVEFRAALAADPGRTEAHNNLGLVLLQAGRAAEAAEEFRRALASEPGNPEVIGNLGAALLELGRTGEAIGEFSRALSLDPAASGVEFNWATALLRGGRAAEAVAHYQRAVALSPGFARAHDDLGNALLQLGRLDEAAAEYRRALEIEPGYAEAHHNLGVVLMRQGRADEARAELQKAR